MSKDLINVVAVVDFENNKKKNENPFSDLFSNIEKNQKSSSKSVSFGSITGDNTQTATKKKTRTKKEVVVDGNIINTPEKEKTPLNSNMSYNKTYEIPKRLLAQSIMQVDDMLSKVNADINEVRGTKFRYAKNKSDLLSSLYMTSNSLIGNRISIARELSSIQNSINRYELEKYKQLASVDSESDDKRLMDLYNAYVNAPMGGIPNNLASLRFNMPPQNLNLPQNAIPVSVANGAIVGDDDTGYNNYIANLTPEQNAMINEKNTQTILVYDQSNQTRWFEVIDNNTGMQVPNMPVPPDFVKDGCTIDIRNGVARNSSLNKTFKLKLVGTRSLDDF